jgi:hypothetical protein
MTRSDEMRPAGIQRTHVLLYPIGQVDRTGSKIIAVNPPSPW